MISTAIEVALKMAIQYQHNRQQKKRKIIAFRNAYHGDTFGAMSVSGRGIWTDPFKELLFEVEFIDVPTEQNLESLKRQVEEIAEETICFIYEPLIQGAAGMLMYEAEPLSALMKYCREQQIVLIQDEVFTGFGRTGRLFATDYLSEEPDIMCFSKGLTGGTMPLGITSCTAAIYEAFYSDDKEQALYHGHSFTASPLACAAALASLDLLLLPETQENIRRIVSQHSQFAEEIKSYSQVKTVRQRGTILALEWKTSEEMSYFSDMHEKLYPYFLARGILLRPLGNIIYLVPPYCISEKELNYIYQTIKQALQEIVPS